MKIHEKAVEITKEVEYLRKLDKAIAVIDDHPDGYAVEVHWMLYTGDYMKAAMITTSDVARMATVALRLELLQRRGLSASRLVALGAMSHSGEWL